MARNGIMPQAFGSPAPQEIFEVSWELFGELCRALALRVYREYDPDIVVGIATAGVIPAAVIADILQVDFYSMKITRRSVGGVPELVSTAPVQAEGKRVLLVDEISTSGETLRLALASLRDVLPEEIRTATCFSRPAGFTPDYHALATDALIVFPWDRKVIEEGEMVVHPTYRGAIEE
jgi:hypoxanthine phosphoribosyltransferase